MAARAKVANVIRELRPRWLFAPYWVDAHPDHVAATELVEAARFWSKLTKTDLPGQIPLTGQPWHPQLEMIARTLTSHRGGKPWIMRRRTQEELDALVAAAGFRKVEQRTDPTGLFTVSLAERL